MKIIIMILASLLVTANVNAIDKHLHPYVTLDALKQYNICTTHTRQLKLNSVDATIISAQTGNEDNGNIERAFNWHFYDAYHVGNPDELNSTYAAPEKKSLHRVFKRRVNTFKDSITKKCVTKSLKSGGSIIHYIQDMGVPAHIAPNYHAKPEKWWEHIFSEVLADPFDSLTHPANSNYFVTEKKCIELQNKMLGLKRLATGKDQHFKVFNSLLTSLAVDTRKSVTTEILPSSKNTFEKEFWMLRKQKKDYYKKLDKEKYGDIKDYFAPYGVDNKREKFNLNKAPCSLEQNKDACKDFVKERYDEILKSTIMALMYISDIRQEKIGDRNPEHVPAECINKLEFDTISAD